MIPMQNIYYMLAYAFRLIDTKSQAKIKPEQFDKLLDLYAAILYIEISRQLKRGLAKGYLDVTDTLRSPRGKLNISHSIKQNTLVKKQLVCDIDEYLEDTELNRIVKTTLLFLIKAEDVQSERKNNLKKLLFYMDQVQETSLKGVKWHSLAIPRHLSSYKKIINICELVATALLIAQTAGTKTLSEVTDDQTIYRLYEKFVLEYYKTHYPQLRPSASVIEWELTGSNTALLPKMQSDITLSHEHRTLIIDTKYYSRTLQTHGMHDTKTLHSQNVYQMYAYVMNKARGLKGSVEGLLLYAKTDEVVTPNQTYSISGHKIGAATLDLNCDFAEIRKQLNGIAEEFMQIKKCGTV